MRVCFWLFAIIKKAGMRIRGETSMFLEFLRLLDLAGNFRGYDSSVCLSQKRNWRINRTNSDRIPCVACLSWDICIQNSSWYSNLCTFLLTITWSDNIGEQAHPVLSNNKTAVVLIWKTMTACKELYSTIYFLSGTQCRNLYETYAGRNVSRQRPRRDSTSTKSMVSKVGFMHKPKTA